MRQTITVVKNEPLKHLKCRFEYPQPTNDSGMCLKVRKYLLEHIWDFPTFRYKLKMDRLCNDTWINSHIQGLMKIWLANIHVLLVVDIDKVIVYMAKYVTKPEIKISLEMNKMI